MRRMIRHTFGFILGENTGKFKEEKTMATSVGCFLGSSNQPSNEHTRSWAIKERGLQTNARIRFLDNRRRSENDEDGSTSEREGNSFD